MSDAADDLDVNSMLQRFRERGFAARRRERNQERLLDSPQERQERHANQHGYATNDDEREDVTLDTQRVIGADEI